MTKQWIRRAAALTASVMLAGMISVLAEQEESVATPPAAPIATSETVVPAPAPEPSEAPQEQPAGDEAPKAAEPEKAEPEPGAGSNAVSETDTKPETEAGSETEISSETETKPEETQDHAAPEAADDEAQGGEETEPAPVPTEQPSETPADVPTEAPKMALSVGKMFLNAGKRTVHPGETVTVDLTLTALNAEGPLDDFFIEVDASGAASAKTLSRGGAVLTSARDGRLLYAVRGAVARQGGIYVDGTDAVRISVALTIPENAEGSVTVGLRLLNASMGDMTPAARQGANRISHGYTLEISAAEEASLTEPAQDEASSAADAPAPETEAPADDGEAAAETSDTAAEKEPSETAGSAGETEAPTARRAWIEQNIASDVAKVGDTLVLTARLEGFEGMDVTVRWQVDRGNGYEDGESGSVLSIALDEENIRYGYRFVVLANDAADVGEDTK